MAPKKILVALRLNYSSNRYFLSGIARFIRHTANWRVTVEQDFSEFTDKMIRQIADYGYDGIITVPPHDSAAERLLEQQNIPLVVIDANNDDLKHRRKNLVFLRGDNEGFGALAAQHFAKLGHFRSYAFITPFKETAWAENRFHGFQRALAQRAESVEKISSPYPSGSPEDIQYLQQALRALPKPLAVLGAYDVLAMHVLQACEAEGLAVPKLVEVLGMDNDPVFCDFSRPALSSISMGQLRVGELAAIELNRLIEKQPQPIRTVITRNAEVISRESTAPLSPATHLVERALEIIERETSTGISARDVIARLGVSRALADRRFRELQGMSIGEAITRRRLALLRQQLRRTDQPIAVLSASCGFATPDHAKRMFKKAYGLSMRDYRITAKLSNPK